MRDKTFKEQRKALRRERREIRRDFFRTRKRSGSVLAGLLLLGIGAVLLLKAFGFPFPEWLFKWPMIVIAFGLLAGAGNAFRDPGWVIICGVGIIFLLPEIPQLKEIPGISIHAFIWPIVIIAIGLIIILAPRRRRLWHNRYEERWKEYGDQWKQYPHDQQTQGFPYTTTTPEPVINPVTDHDRNSPDSWVEAVTIFGNVKKLVYSKNFKGGDIVSIFGGAEINLTQADFKGQIVIELVQIFGGAKLIIPPHWQVRSDMVAIFGGIEDKRAPQSNFDNDKVVILNGVTFFGGIEIKSYG